MLTKRHVGGVLASLLGVALVATLGVVTLAPRTPHVNVVARGSRAVADATARVLRAVPRVHGHSIEKGGDEAKDRAMFAKHDTDGDGVLSLAEFSLEAKSQNVFKGSQVEMARFFAFLDVDGDRKLTFDEYNGDPPPEAIPWYAASAVRNFDADGDGMLDATELHAHIVAMLDEGDTAPPPPAVSAMLRSADGDGDEKLSAGEWACFLHAVVPTAPNDSGAAGVSTGKMYDLDGDGYVDPSEMQKMMAVYGDGSAGSTSLPHLKLFLCQIDEIPPIDFKVPTELMDARSGGKYQASEEQVRLCMAALLPAERAAILA